MGNATHAVADKESPMCNLLPHPTCPSHRAAKAHASREGPTESHRGNEWNSQGRRGLYDMPAAGGLAWHTTIMAYQSPVADWAAAQTCIELVPDSR